MPSVICRMLLLHTLLRPFLGFREGGHEHAGKNGNDGDDHQQFDQCKSVLVASILEGS